MFIVLTFRFRINVSIYRCSNCSICINFYFYCTDFLIYLFNPSFWLYLNVCMFLFTDILSNISRIEVLYTY